MLTKKKIIIPNIGNNIQDIVIINWIKKEGDFIKKNEPIVEISTDKIDTEILSNYTGKVKKILGNEEPVPNIGQLIPIWQNFLIPEFIKENYYYHTHSYYCNVTDKNCSVLASIHYNKISIPVIIKKNNLLGFQFHPELSNYQGLALLKYFVNE